MTPLDDPQLVREEYATECGLEARASIYRWADGPDATVLMLEAVAEIDPRRILDVGCGRGQFAERIARELGASVIGVDQSERMVQLTRARGIDAVVGDVRALPFDPDEFDCVLAAWMLFHVTEVDAALAEIARVLRPGGRLVAVTNGLAHMGELRRLVGAPPMTSTFSAENGEELLRRHFRTVETRDASGTVHFPDREAAQAYVDASFATFGGAETRLPDATGALVVTRAPCVFVAET